MNPVVGPVPPALLAGTWHRGCPVPASRLRLLSLNYVGFDGAVHRGQLVVNETQTAALTRVFGKALAARFPIRRMQPMSAFGGNDLAAMAADNTSVFNCRKVTGDPRWVSEHSYGDAIDINPAENPYVVGGRVLPAGSQPYLGRSPARKGMITAGSALEDALAAEGWIWGVSFPEPDYQHFSVNGR